MYNIENHIASLKHKGEDWAAKQVDAIRTLVETVTPFDNNLETVVALGMIMYEQKKKRDEFEEYSVEYQLEWSILLIIENMRHLVKCGMEKQNE